MRRTTMLPILLVVAALGGGAPAAMAQSPTESAYRPTPIDIIGQIKNSPPADITPPRKVSTSSLPFTGLNIGVVAGVAVLLLGLGVGLRRVARHTP